MKTLKVAAAGLILSMAGLARADRVHMKSGRILEGKIVESGKEQVVLEGFDGRFTIAAARIAKAQKTGTRSAYEEYLDLLEKGDESARGHLRLAALCVKGRAWKKAEEHLEAARELEPESKEQARELKNLEAKRKAWLASLPKPVGVVVNIGVKQALSEEEKEKIAKEAVASSELLGKISLGGLYFSEVVFTIGADKGHLVYDKEFTGLPNGWENIPMGIRNWWAPVIVHEVGHAVFGLPDDDNAGGGGKWGVSKYPCIMAHHWKEGFGPCCRAALEGRHPELKHFFDLFEEELGPVPAPKITFK